MILKAVSIDRNTEHHEFSHPINLGVVTARWIERQLEDLFVASKTINCVPVIRIWIEIHRSVSKKSKKIDRRRSKCQGNKYDRN